MRSAGAFSTAICFATLAGPARAAPCGRPDVDATFPPDAATGIPSDARLSAHYAAPAQYDDEPVSVTDADGSPVALDVSFDAASALLTVTPAQALAAGVHEVRWPGLRSVGAGGVGRGSTARFTVSGDVDVASPVFDGLQRISWDLARDRDPCLDRLEDRFVFRLQRGEAWDDTGTGSLSLLIFETAAPAAAQLTGPRQVALLPYPEDAQVELRRPATDPGRTCFAAVVQDLLGKVSGGGEREVCAVTQPPPFFEGCSSSPRFPPPAGTGAWCGAALLVLLYRRGRSASGRS